MNTVLTAVAVKEVLVAKMGRPTLFKKDGMDIHGRVSKTATRAFKVAKRNLKNWRKEWKGRISDGDVLEFLLLGAAALYDETATTGAGKKAKSKNPRRRAE